MMLRWQLSLTLLFVGCVSVDAEDIDSDGFANVIDNCAEIKNPGQEDGDGDGVGDVCDNCEDLSNSDQSDQDQDSVGDVCDNCANVANSDQRNNDDDSLGDACDNCDAANNEDQSDGDGDNVGDACDNCPTLSSTDVSDSDSDSIGNPCDCDPFDAQVGPELESINLGQNNSLEAATGYNFQHWSHANGAALQDSGGAALVNNQLDSALLALNQQVQDVFIEVTAASTASTNFDTTDDRIVFINARYKDNANSTGVGCGIRVDETQATTQRLQITNISGTSGNPTLTKIADQVRNAVNFNETFKLSFKLKGTNATCKMTFLQQGNTELTINNTATPATSQLGAIGLFTRETNASFSNIKICQVF